MTKRAKRAIKNNPREERNTPEYSKRNSQGQKNRNQRNGQVQNNNGPFSKPLKKDIDIVPRSINQEDLLLSLENPNKSIVFAIGPAGSGKTLISTLYAIKCLKEKTIDKIVITRPNIAVDDKDIGFLPGDIMSKMAPWIRPITAEMEEYFSKEDIEKLILDGTIEIIPVAYLRGRTFKNSIILLDEAQNTTPTSLLSALTRIGENSKMIITGDIKQSDRKTAHNGLADFVTRFSDKENSMISVVHFNHSDVQRHPVIKEILTMYKDVDL